MRDDDRNEMIEITAELVWDRESSWAVWQGGMEPDPRNSEQQRKVLIFLPKSACRRGDKKNEWQVPMWLAKEKGLI